MVGVRVRRSKNALLAGLGGCVCVWGWGWVRVCLITTVCNGTHSLCAAVAPLARPLHYKPIGHLSRPAFDPHRFVEDGHVAG